MQLDHLDRRLLNLVQTEFPICPQPYLALAEKLGITEQEVLQRLERLMRQDVLRRLGGVFDSRKLGYKGTLCAIKVPPERIDEVAAVINSYVGITHNYLRDHEYNMWFTILARSSAKVEQILSEIRAKTGIEEIINLPSQRFFKVLVKFDVTDED
ncbi:AsnC family transcriptional regulator [Desulforamulus hydrothermalis]|uniref:siroheme decarboxylase n=1 Tax=Desulforamulus hydrothermalis Lam5 = DSM 18033 TaxID=1121428 RepID=K8EDX0_9FIRM|nr:AsnC family transcriptional regulator [Desulforamulus hydrothermalis]CCO06996.1 Protein nirD [Desulforamulus hydrothermalis Lam5 = DSM 18033]SHG98022.1 transcriptional regulator, AsnC family [Desulforamulus hydrothermalis Lam5 = DSM 18033]